MTVQISGPSSLACPLATAPSQKVSLAHGGGGRAMQQLIADSFLLAYGNASLALLHDGATLAVGSSRIAFATDSYVVRPIFFPGGDIGSLAVHGTVNDLAMCGAMPIALSVAMILEEGFAISDLDRISRSIGESARCIGVEIVTGDTKVVEHGKGDGIYLNTTGIGLIPQDIDIRPNRATPGDVVLISGPIAAHGMAVMSVREGLEFESSIRSDTAPLNQLVASMLRAGGSHVHVLRDPTRGGVASALNEIAAAASVGIDMEERCIPIDSAVQAACEFLGLDPLYVANEGICLAIVDSRIADRVQHAMQATPAGARSTVIGRVVSEHPGKVVLKSRIGSGRVVPMLSGEQLPRIC